MNPTRTFCGLAWLVLALVARAADPYLAKPIHSLVGYSPGGSFDLYARVLARYIGRYLPGNPTRVVENMTGGNAMKLGDVTAKNYPKMTLIAPPRAGGSICTRSFIPHVCHEAIGVLAAVTVATACVLDGSITQGIASMPPGNVKKVSVEHPTGEFSVEIEVDLANPQSVTRAALLRTARLLMRGEVMVPRSVWTRQPTTAAAGK